MKNIQLKIGIALIALLLVTSFIGPYLPFIDKELEETRAYRSENGDIHVAPYSPSEDYIIGSDRLGRDLLSLLIVGAKETLFYIFIIVLIRYCFAFILGTLAFWYNGIFKLLLTILNQLFSRLPTIFTTILIINIPFFLISNVRPTWIIVIIAFTEVGRVGDIIYNHLKSISTAAYIDSGIVTGVSTLRLFRFYYLPALIPQLIINIVMDLGRTALLLGQLGLFSVFISQEWYMYERFIVELKITSQAWPTMLGNVIRDLRSAPWIPFWATFAITYTIVSFNILGEGLKKHFLLRQSS